MRVPLVWRAATPTLPAMPNHLNFKFTTVRGGGPPVEIRCSCDDFWSVAQQRAMLELYPRAPNTDPHFINLSRETIRIIPPPREPGLLLAEGKGLEVLQRRLDGLGDMKSEPEFSSDPLVAQMHAEQRERMRKREVNPVVIERYQRGGLRYATRARLIARAYACMFLEDFEHGNPKRQGRFYWAGLAAFASKQVACTLENLLAR
ncbi:hypothetical protein [Thiomonas sp. FB-6]|uniref:DUF2515 family protein n=1 Tax=Thiomonas sp. FB-6 TaxID=1158291 RepID=UPI00047709CC|nr:hypothetical protein [Thiomonas sp. FB-6]